MFIARLCFPHVLRRRQLSERSSHCPPVCLRVQSALRRTFEFEYMLFCNLKLAYFSKVCQPHDGSQVRQVGRRSWKMLVYHCWYECKINRCFFIATTTNIALCVMQFGCGLHPHHTQTNDNILMNGYG